MKNKRIRHNAEYVDFDSFERIREIIVAEKRDKIYRSTLLLHMKNIYLKPFINSPCNSLNDSKIKSHNN